MRAVVGDGAWKGVVEQSKAGVVGSRQAAAVGVPAASPVLREPATTPLTQALRQAPAGAGAEWSTNGAAGLAGSVDQKTSPLAASWQENGGRYASVSRPSPPLAMLSPLGEEAAGGGAAQAAGSWARSPGVSPTLARALALAAARREAMLAETKPAEKLDPAMAAHSRAATEAAVGAAAAAAAAAALSPPPVAAVVSPPVPEAPSARQTSTAAPAAAAPPRPAYETILREIRQLGGARALRKAPQTEPRPPRERWYGAGHGGKAAGESQLELGERLERALRLRFAALGSGGRADDGGDW